MSKIIYFTFPIEILKDGYFDIKTALDNAMCYCFYYNFINEVGAESENLEYAAKKLKIKFSSPKRSFETGKSLYKAIPENSPKTSITHDMLFGFYSNQKTEFEIFTFLAFAALKSIIQKQAYIKCTNIYLLSRITGNSKVIEEINLPDWVFKYNNRYQLDKVKKELRINWGLKYYSLKNRGFYVSFSMTLKDLAVVAESKRVKYKEQLLKKKTELAFKEALEELRIRGLL